MPCLHKVFVQKEFDLFLRIIDQTEQGDRSGGCAKASLHPLGRSKREFALVKDLLQIMYRESLVAFENYKVVFVPFMVPEK